MSRSSNINLIVCDDGIELLLRFTQSGNVVKNDFCFLVLLGSFCNSDFDGVNDRKGGIPVINDLDCIIHTRNHDFRHLRSVIAVHGFRAAAPDKQPPGHGHVVERDFAIRRAAADDEVAVHGHVLERHIVGANQDAAFDVLVVGSFYRDITADDIMENLRKTSNIDAFGIEVLAIETKQIDLPDENKSAVYERMISERENIAASYTAEGAAQAKEIRNDADKAVDITLSQARAEAEKLKAEGEAEYMRILSAVYDTQEEADFYEFVRALDMARSALTGGNKTLVLGSDSPIAQIFTGGWQSAE